MNKWIVIIAIVLLTLGFAAFMLTQPEEGK